MKVDPMVVLALLLAASMFANVLLVIQRPKDKKRDALDGPYKMPVFNTPDNKELIERINQCHKSIDATIKTQKILIEHLTDVTEEAEGILRATQAIKLGAENGRN